MSSISTLTEAQVYAQNNNCKLVKGFFARKSNGSVKCIAFFLAKKEIFNQSEESTGTNSGRTDSTLKARNVTLWNSIDHIGSYSLETFVRLLYVCSIVFLLPLADWIIGQLKNEHEIVSIYNKNTDPFNPAESPIVECISI